MKRLLTFIRAYATMLITTSCFTQNAHFIQNGIIEFEKRSNMYAIIKRKINLRNESYMMASFDSYKKSNPQFKSSNSTLRFNADKSLYRFGHMFNIYNFWIDFETRI